MGSIPSNLARVPNLLTSRFTNASISRTGVEMLKAQAELTSGRRINTPSDDPIGASLVSVIDERLERAAQRERNFSHAGSTLSTLDQTLRDIGDLVQEANSVALSQIGIGSDSATRSQQAGVVQSLIDEIASLSNTDFVDIFLLGGERTEKPPVEAFFDGFRYVGGRGGLKTDLGDGLTTAITIGGEEALGALSARVDGDVDLNPALTLPTRLADLRGATGAGVSLTQVEVEITNGPVTTIQVDLSTAESVEDAANIVESAMRQADPTAFAGAFPSVGVSATGDRFELTGLAVGASIVFREVGGGTTAADLGLSGFTYDNVNTENVAVDLDPKLTEFTTFADLNPAGGFTPGNIVFTNGGRTGTVAVTGAMTFGEFFQRVEALQLGVRAELDTDARTLNVVNEVSGWQMTIEEDGGGTLTATGLGIRSMRASTLVSVLNNGKGVEIADAVVNPVTGLLDPALNVDFRVTLSDGSTFDVDFTPADMTNIGAVIAKINADAAAAGFTIGAAPGDIQAVLADGANGIVIEDNLAGGGAVSVTQLNGRAAEDLGFLNGVFTAGAPATFAAEDRSKVRVDSLLTTLIDLRDALNTNSDLGIQLAGERLASDIERVVTARATAGGRAQRVEAGARRLQEESLLDETVRSGVQDSDFAEATTRLALLSRVQQAAFASASVTQRLSLLDFIG